MRKFYITIISILITIKRYLVREKEKSTDNYYQEQRCAAEGFNDYDTTL